MDYIESIIESSLEGEEPSDIEPKPNLIINPMPSIETVCV
jgi:hypothetical protein